MIERIFKYKRKPLTEEHKRKLSEIGKKRITSLETRRKMSINRKGKIPKNFEMMKKPFEKNHTVSDEIRRKIGLGNKGKKLTKEHKIKIGNANRGEKNYRWKGGYENKLWHNRQRRVQKLNAGGIHTQEQWENLKKRYNYMCLCCKQEEPFIILSEDHIVPLSKGGLDNIENIQPLCRSCNSKKHIKIINYINIYDTKNIL